MKKVILCLLWIGFPSIMIGQVAEVKPVKNIIKYGISIQFFPDYEASGLCYERILNENISIEGDFFLLETNYESVGGIIINPKFYIFQKPAPRGIYIAPCLGIGLNTAVGYGLGINIGVQWFRRRLTLEAFIGTAVVYSVTSVSIFSSTKIKQFNELIYPGFKIGVAF